MIFLELVLQNFGPYKGRQVINLSPNSTSPIILFGGMNGGGKTTLMDAIRLALYGPRAGCSTRGNLSYSDFLTQCVNSQISTNDTVELAFEDKTRVELAFEHIENDRPVRYRVVRTWEKNPKDGKDHLGILDIRDQDEWLDTGLVNIWEEYIENLLPLGISNLFLFDGEQVKELAEQDEPPPLVVEAIRGLLGLELAERLAVDLDILVNRKRKEIADTKDLINLEEIEQNIKQLQAEHDRETQNFNTLKTELETQEKIQQAAFDKFLNEGGKIAAERSKLETKAQEKTDLAENIRQSMCELAAKVLPLGLIEQLLNQAQIQGEIELRCSQEKIAKDILTNRDKKLLKLIDQLDISSEKVEKIKSFIDSDIETRENSLQQETWLLADAESLSSLGNIIYKLDNSQLTASQQIKTLKNTEEEIITLERQIQTAAAPEAYQKLVNALQSAQDKVASSKVILETTRRRIVELEVAIDKFKKDLKKYTEDTIDRKNTGQIVAASTKVQETLKLFRDRLTLRKLNKLENEVSECFRYLLHKSDLVHRIAIDTHSFRLSLYNLSGKPVPKHRLSAGEKQLLAIAFLWGLARVSGRHLPVAIDTPLGRLDSSHRNNLVERYFPSASHQVILLSTDTEIALPEVQTLRNREAIAREYLLKYSNVTRQTTVKPGYFWD